MRRLLIPFILVLFGLGLGAAVGWFLRPGLPDAAHAVEGESSSPAAPPPTETVGEVQRLPSQFVVPLITDGRVRAMIALSLGIGMLPGQSLDLVRDEPRLRAVFLQILFDHANSGGFDGNFTGGEQLLTLRRTLTDAARAEMGPAIQSVLILDLMRQDHS